MAENDLNYLLGKMAGSLEAIHSDINEIKDTQIPNGKERINKIEEKVQKLSVWKGSVMMIGAGFVAVITWLGSNLEKIGRIFHG